MKRRILGASGSSVSGIGLGCWGMSGSYGPADEAESVARSCGTLMSRLGLAEEAGMERGHR